MLIAECTIKTKAKPEAIWALWSDVANWKRWDQDVLSSELNGPFEAGSIGYLKPKGGPKTKFRTMEVVPGKSFWDRSFLPLTALDFKHSMERKGNETIVTHRVEMSGLLTFLFSRIVGKNIKKGLPEAVKRLVEIAESAGV